MPARRARARGGGGVARRRAARRASRRLRLPARCGHHLVGGLRVNDNDWFRPRPSGRPQPGGYPGSGEPTESLPRRGSAGQPWGAGQPAGQPGYQSGSRWPEQPRGAPPAAVTSPGRRRAAQAAPAATAVAAVAAAGCARAGSWGSSPCSWSSSWSRGIGLYFYTNSKLTGPTSWSTTTGARSRRAGTNWLITGSDSRQGLTRAAGTPAGHRDRRQQRPTVRHDLDPAHPVERRAGRSW